MGRQCAESLKARDPTPCHTYRRHRIAIPPLWENKKAGRQAKEERRLQQLPMWIPQTDTNFHNTCGEEDRWEEAQCHTFSLQSSSIPAKAVESAERFGCLLAPSALSIVCHSWGAKQVGVPVPTPDCHCNLYAVRGDGRSKGHQEAAKAADQAASRPPAGRQQASLSASWQD